MPVGIKRGGLVGHVGEAAGPRAGSIRLSLLGSFELTCGGQPVQLPLSAQRLLAFLALHDRPLHRAYVAGTLWLETTEQRSHASLRSTIWRLRRPGYHLIEAVGAYLRLSPDLDTDVRESAATARRLIDGPASVECGDLERLGVGGDLLVDWYEDWVALERERFRQLRLHALELLCRGLIALGRYAEAVQAGLAAVAGEPLRESAQRALISVHLAEGNHSEAIRQYQRYEKLLGHELGLRPSSEMETLVSGLRIR